MEKIIETQGELSGKDKREYPGVKKCKCGVEFNITQNDLDFLEQISPVIGGKKYLISKPTLCPDCRNRRRLSFRNERNIYKRQCDATGKTILSVFSPDKPYKVYEHTIWAGDSWSGLDYARDFDFSRPFFEQFNELLKEVPQQSIFSVNCENSDYAQMINGKNDYLTFVGINAEDTMYSHWMVNTKNSIDCLRCQDIELCYDCTHCYENSFNLKSCFNCKNSSSSSFCFNLVGCKNCFMSGNLVNKQYVFRGKELSKEEYEKAILGENISLNYDKLKQEMKNLMSNSIFRANSNYNSENVSGDFIKNSKNLENCYEVDETYDCKNFFDNAGYCNNCRDATYGWQSSNCYEVLGADGNHNLFQVMNIVGTNDSIYTYASYNCSEVFGCVCLKDKKYCILNKQYTREEYETLVPKIIEHMKTTGEWGEFLPVSISPFGYNESAAQDHYPLNKNEILELGFKYSDYENPKPEVSKIIPASKLPQDISEIPDDILNWAIECDISGKPFRIIKQELDFYRNNNLPIPKFHPDERHKTRLQLRNPRHIYKRNCNKCSVGIETTFSPDRSEIIYCESCYDNLVS